MRLEVARALAQARAHGICEGCGTYHGGSLEAHHRLARGMGGVRRAGAEAINHVSNLLELCQPCHRSTEAADTWRECAAKGWRFRHGSQPGEHPALIHTVNGYGWWYLTPEGGYGWADLPDTYRITTPGETQS